MPREGAATFVLLLLGFHQQGFALRCFACNVVVKHRELDFGCTNPQVITCSSPQGFKERFCFTAESVAHGAVVSRSCATSRQCHEVAIPGVRVHCCEEDLCNGGLRTAATPPHVAAHATLLLTLTLLMGELCT
ncbi:uncharacterized protein LOC144948385 [Lampetra fluviatilis]